MSNKFSFDPIKFIPNEKDEFSAVLRKKINQYFKENGLSRYGNGEMYFKTVVMFALYLIPYFLFISGISTGWLFLLSMAILMGIGKAGIGLSVMHDANHGSYSKNQWVNRILGHSINFCAGASSTNWKIQHNVLHHTYTNIEGMDEDIELGVDIMKFAPQKEKVKGLAKYQYLYAWFLYGFLTLNWTLAKDFFQITRYKKMNLIKTQQTSYRKEIIVLIITKLFYFGYIFVLPMVLLGLPFWKMAILFVVMHFVTGSILSWVFQLAHVIEETVFPEADKDKIINEGFFAHQLRTTANFKLPKIGSWYVGGLNYQIEHHLFPNISHIHYKNLMPIVKQTAEEYGLPYHSIKSFGAGMKSHVKWLKQVSQQSHQLA